MVLQVASEFEAAKRYILYRHDRAGEEGAEPPKGSHSYRQVQSLVAAGGPRREICAPRGPSPRPDQATAPFTHSGSIGAKQPTLRALEKASRTTA
jgi:hypothetical protein